MADQISKEVFLERFKKYCEIFMDGKRNGLYEIAEDRVDKFGSPRIAYVDGYNDGWHDCIEGFAEIGALIYYESVNRLPLNTGNKELDQIVKSNLTAEKQ